MSLKKYYKVIGRNYGNHTYQLGENHCDNFLYFTTYENIPTYLGYYGHLICTVEVSEDTKIISVSNTDYKSKKIIITSIQTIKSFIKNNSDFLGVCRKFLGDFYTSLLFFKKEDMSILAVKKDQSAIRFLPKLTPKICMVYKDLYFNLERISKIYVPKNNDKGYKFYRDNNAVKVTLTILHTKF